MWWTTWRAPVHYADAVDDMASTGTLTFRREEARRPQLKNTLNLRILITKDTLAVRSADVMSMLAVYADQVVCGS